VAFLNYEYRMKIVYSEPVDKCYFTIKGIPAEDFRQRNISYDITLTPSTTYSESVDSFGNKQIIGSEKYPHLEFEYLIKGLLETHEGNLSGGINNNIIGMYKYPHGLCIPGEAIKQFASDIYDKVNGFKSTKDKAVCIMNLLYEKMQYESGSTEIETTAEEAFVNGKGVCQDFAHIYICLLRLFNIPARYVCGLILGEGQSHAWVEAACEDNYIAFDPTYNKAITDEYIKFGVGRDAKDCTINRGVMWGGGLQTQTVNVTVVKYF